MKPEKIKIICASCEFEITIESDCGTKIGKCPRCKNSLKEKNNECAA